MKGNHALVQSLIRHIVSISFLIQTGSKYFHIIFQVIQGIRSVLNGIVNLLFQGAAFGFQWTNGKY